MNSGTVCTGTDGCTCITSTERIAIATGSMSVVKLNVTSGIREKGQAIASAITGYMTGRGVHVPTLVNNVVKTGRKFHVPFSGHKATAAATLEIQDSGAMYRNVRAGQAVADYCVSAHEFGHMFGLPDESATPGCLASFLGNGAMSQTNELPTSFAVGPTFGEARKKKTAVEKIHPAIVTRSRWPCNTNLARSAW